MIRTKILIFNTIVTILGIVLFGFWYFIDGKINPPITYNHDTENVQVDKEVYQTGDYVSIYVDFCKNREVSGTSAWTLVDTVKLFYPERTANAPVGCYEGWFQTVRLPEIVSPGIYHLEVTAVSQINPIKKVTFNSKTEQFYIE